MAGGLASRPLSAPTRPGGSLPCAARASLIQSTAQLSDQPRPWGNVPNYCHFLETVTGVRMQRLGTDGHWNEVASQPSRVMERRSATWEDFPRTQVDDDTTVADAQSPEESRTRPPHGPAGNKWWDWGRRLSNLPEVVHLVGGVGVSTQL